MAVEWKMQKNTCSMAKVSCCMLPSILINSSLASLGVARRKGNKQGGSICQDVSHGDSLLNLVDCIGKIQ